jgi:hypothetical protein
VLVGIQIRTVLIAKGARDLPPDVACRNAPEVSSRNLAISIWEICMKTRMNIDLAPLIGAISGQNHA